MSLLEFYKNVFYSFSLKNIFTLNFLWVILSIKWTFIPILNIYSKTVFDNIITMVGIEAQTLTTSKNFSTKLLSFKGSFKYLLENSIVLLLLELCFIINFAFFIGDIINKDVVFNIKPMLMVLSLSLNLLSFLLIYSLLNLSLCIKNLSMIKNDYSKFIVIETLINKLTQLPKSFVFKEYRVQIYVVYILFILNNFFILTLIIKALF